MLSKKWKILPLTALAVLGGVAFANQNHVSANNINDNQNIHHINSNQNASRKVTLIKPNETSSASSSSIDTAGIQSEADALHNRIVSNASSVFAISKQASNSNATSSNNSQPASHYQASSVMPKVAFASDNTNIFSLISQSNTPGIQVKTNLANSSNNQSTEPKSNNTISNSASFTLNTNQASVSSENSQASSTSQNNISLSSQSVKNILSNAYHQIAPIEASLNNKLNSVDTSLNSNKTSSNTNNSSSISASNNSKPNNASSVSTQPSSSSAKLASSNTVKQNDNSVTPISNSSSNSKPSNKSTTASQSVSDTINYMYNNHIINSTKLTGNKGDTIDINNNISNWFSPSSNTQIALDGTTHTVNLTPAHQTLKAQALVQKLAVYSQKLRSLENRLY